MAEERDENEFNQTDAKAGQQPAGQQGQPGQFQQSETMSEGALGDQSSSGEAATDTDTLQTDRPSSQGTDSSTEEGFIGSQAGDNDDDSDIETGQSRSQDNDSDIEGSSGAA